MSVPVVPVGNEKKRRISLSKGNLLEVKDHDDDDDCRSVTSCKSGASSRRRSLGGRRRSSFGSHTSKTPMSSAEQTRIAEMYKTVIKMSSENKINMKNSWQYDLIDHMGNLIKDDATGQRGINFQKASCTLDASVKIYSNRVDDTHASSHRILESLSRTYTNDDGEGNQRGTARVGSKNASSKLNIAETIETNVDNLNFVKVEAQQATDPMFHKMSKAFDAGGAKGMLMANLRVLPTDCSLVFAASQMPANTEHTFSPIESSNATTAVGSVTPPASRSNGCVDISDLIFKCGFDASSLLALSVCPALEDYRSTIGMTETTSGAFDVSDYLSYFPPSVMIPPSMSSMQGNEAAVTTTSSSSCSSGGGTNSQMTSANANDVVASSAVASIYDNHNDDHYDGGNNYDDDGDNDNDYGDGGHEDFGEGGFNDEPFATASAAARASLGGGSSSAANRRISIVPGTGTDAHHHKIQWLSDDTSSPGTATASEMNAADVVAMIEGAEASPNAVVWDASGITSTNDYSFFDLDVINKTNSWAGARHWKYGTRRAAAITTSSLLPSTAEENQNRDDEEENEEGEITNKKGVAKAAEKKKSSTKKADKKDKFEFDFSGPWVSEDLFAVPAANKRGGDVTCLTSAALEKEASASAVGELFLPPDAKLQTSDLCRLMSCTNIIVPPPMLAHAFFKQISAASSSSRSQNAARGGGSGRTGLYASAQGPDVIWGQVRKVVAPPGASFAGAFGQATQATWSGNDDYDGYDDGDNDGGDYGEDFCDADNDGLDSNNRGGSTVIEEPERVGLFINTNALLRAPRLVEKIDIGFATTAKRVNVKKLKTNIWSHIDELEVSPSASSQGRSGENDENGENETPNGGMSHKRTSVDKKGGAGTGDALSFQELVCDIANEEKCQKDVTVSFYFICLLHLANEKTLKIEGSPLMNDLIISKASMQ